MNKKQICKRGVWDSTIPGIVFDKNGVSNYAIMFDQLCEKYPRGVEGERKWDKTVLQIKKQGKGKRYDCIIGVSGGTDSSYLMHIAKNIYGLRPLAVNLDNGWNSDIAVRNIKKVTKALDIDLETYVINYEEVKAVLRSYMKAGLPWIDGPTDHAIDAVLYKIAAREGVKHILNGSDFRSEGKQPSEWSYTDAKQMLFVLNKFENVRLKSYPYQKIYGLFRHAFIKGIKSHRPFNNIEYQKNVAQKFLISEYDWEYYGGHHHENIFTKFAISYWMPRKFGIDKRIITLSAQVLNGEISRDRALEELKKLPYDSEQMERDKQYVIKKLGFSLNEFDQIWNGKNKYYWDYPSYMPLLEKYSKKIVPLLKLVYPDTPTIFIERENRKIT